MDEDDDCCYFCVLLYDECIYLNETTRPPSKKFEKGSSCG